MPAIFGEIGWGKGDGQERIQNGMHYLTMFCFHHANYNVTTIVPLCSNPKNNSPQSVYSLHFTLPVSNFLI